MAWRDRLTQAVFPVGSDDGDSPLLPIARQFVWTVPLVVLLGLVGSLFEGVGIGLLVPFIYLSQSSSLPDNLPQWLSPATDFLATLAPNERLMVVGAAILLMILLKAIVGITNAMVVANIEGRVGAEIRSTLSRRLLDAGYGFFIQRDAAHLVNIVSSDAWRATDAVRLIFSLATSVAAITVFGTFLLVLEWRLTLIVAVGVILIRLGYVLYGRRLRSKSERISEVNRILAERMLMLINAVRLIFVFAQERREQRRFEDASEEVRRAMYSMERATLVVGPIFEFALATLFIAVLIIAHLLAIPLAIAGAFLVLLYRLQPHLMTINQSRINLAAIRGSTRQVEWLLAGATAMDRTGTAAVPDLRQNDIVFENVSFRFPGEGKREDALKQASFTIRAGETTALIGRSGAGKTTIVNLLCRLLEPTGGTISVGPTPLSAIELDAWRHGIALAGQDIDLVEGTIAQNIAYGSEDSADSDIREAARLADADGFIADLPAGYDTPVSMRGLSLSGGQRQRIGLARALLRRPKLLILDEATNAVDGLSEATIMRLLHDHRRFDSAIVISHRRSTLAACQRGIVLADGRVIDAGPLHELDFVRDMEQPMMPEAS